MSRLLPGNTYGVFLICLVLTSIVPWGISKARAASTAPTDSVIISGSSHIRLHQIGARILEKIYAKAGIHFQWEALPTRRSLVEANAGTYDGEIARIPGASSQYSNLIAVPSPIMAINGRVYTVNVNRDIQSWQDLKGLHVGIVRGELYAERGTQDIERTSVRDYRQLFQLLLSGKADAVIGIDTEADFNVAKYFPGKGIHTIGRSVFKAPLHHLVHKKNAYLVPQLNKIIRAMIEDGSLEAIYRRAAADLGGN
ncbi:amino acid ABC transporter substrate-binding protein (PAAT family) [Varunaivibrio sulfuroxidans]|uniref:Amino acid ABC transporter substrate-binding protein (PAAT family) n=1 Tax=Varunaivibrio sulfuroxidans TaxID=1773489 RepID=A0A4R3JEV5_9PROT|nr:amino acid ABC transporter substrate-binding protein (PAAT family) [Varunaivibrio sulfuroxidans]